MSDQGTIPVLEALRRSKLAQWALAYAAGAWLLLQVVAFLAESYEWPRAALRWSVGIAIVGFVLVLMLAWYHGERGERRVGAVEALLIATVIAIGGGLVWRIESATPPESAAAAVARLPVAAPARSVAVLAFEDISPDRNDAWFAEGLSEEIINSLAQVPELEVTARTSAFHFRGSALTVPDIAARLGVAHVVEGSVRRAGARLRITAQLIRAADGFHVWSQTYDRDAGDVFAVQEDIAGRIATELDVYLDAARRERMFADGTRSVAAFEAYLKGKQVINAAHADREGLARGLEGNALLDQAIAADPGFAAAYLLRHDVWVHVAFGDIPAGVSGAPDVRAPASLAEAAAWALADLDAAAARTRAPKQRLATEINRDFLSGTWSRIPARLREWDALEDPCVEQSTANWAFAAGVLVGEAVRVRDLIASCRAKDPLASGSWESQINAELALGDPASVLEIAERAEAAIGERNLVGVRAIMLARLGRDADVLALAAQHPDVRAYSLRAAHAVALFRQGRPAEAEAELATGEATSRIRDMRIWYLREIGARTEADALAAEIDATPMGAAQLGRLVYLIGNRVPFDTARTPRFAAALAGVGRVPVPLDAPAAP